MSEIRSSWLVSYSKQLAQIEAGKSLVSFSTSGILGNGGDRVPSPKNINKEGDGIPVNVSNIIVIIILVNNRQV
jgi:hypothetical protein